MADGRIVRVADARLSGIFWALINATQAPNPGYIWLLMWMPGVSALLTCRILRGPLSASAGRIAGDLDQRHRRLPRLRLGASSRRLVHEMDAGDLGIGLVIVATVVAVVFWLKRGELPQSSREACG